MMRQNRSPLIKICGLQTPDEAIQAVQAGADFIGIIFDPLSRHYVDMACARQISQAVKKSGAVTVAVFAEHYADEMEILCQFAGIEFIQLHGRRSREQHYLLPENYVRLYVHTVLPNGQMQADDANGLIHCKAWRDFLLVDNVKPGKGQVFNWNNFSYNNDFRLCFAGGLNAGNIGLAIQKFGPYIVDVSSGVENSSGKKDNALIQAFIQAVYTSSRRN